MKGLLSKDYAKERAKLIQENNNEDIGPGDPYPFQGEKNPFTHLLEKRKDALAYYQPELPIQGPQDPFLDHFLNAGTTSIQAADAEGWVVSVTPSGGWIPAAIAGNTGVGLSQRMQSFVLDEAMNPFNVLEPGKRPRVTLTPSMALKTESLSFVSRPRSRHSRPKSTSVVFEYRGIRYDGTGSS